MYASIIIDITHEKLDRVFEYDVPKELEDTLRVGSEVLVPFGKGNRPTSGYIIGFSQTCRYDPNKIKPILKAAGGKIAIESRLVELAGWMKANYGGTMIQALKTVLPIKKEEKEKEQRQIRRLISGEEGRQYLAELKRKRQTARARLLEALLEDPVLEYSLVLQKLNVTASVIRALEERGILQVETKRVYRNPMPKEMSTDREPIVFTEEQQAAIAQFQKDYQSQIYKTYLLYGVTGSGKTEVYMEMISQAAAAGRQSIMLIPEIALTYQTVMRFYRRFGNRVSVMHSRMSAGERFDQMMRARKGEIDVMIGPRSALFTPFPNLGLIVVDEEHEPAYKSEQAPRYHARETAIERARMEGASVVLGSATPSLEAYYACQKGQFTLLRLPNRSRMQSLPKVDVVDMRSELKKGNRSILSDRLAELIEDRLKKHQQVMLFLNRRGYAGFLSCRACGYVVKCPHCDVSLSEHRGGRLLCHYCGYESKKPAHCPTCGSPHIGGFRAGTQQIEEIVKRRFPMARVLRMDMDTTKRKDSYEQILSSFSNEEADILIGTQMIVKGHDFPKVTLVGVLAADLSLYISDYRAAERTFTLLCQAAGRAGRGEVQGEVVIQTYSPDHYSIEAAAKQDYERFYAQEMQYRELMGYPPAAQLLAVLLTAEEEAYLELAAGYLKQFMERAQKACIRDGEEALQIIGPASPYVGKVNDIYRRIIYVKHERYQALTALKDKMEQYIEINRGFDKVRIQFDFNPVQAF